MQQAAEKRQQQQEAELQRQAGRLSESEQQVRQLQEMLVGLQANTVEAQALAEVRQSAGHGINCVMPMLALRLCHGLACVLDFTGVHGYELCHSTAPDVIFIVWLPATTLRRHISLLTSKPRSCLHRATSNFTV